MGSPSYGNTGENSSQTLQAKAHTREFRYYGESRPFPVNNETTKEQWQFHTVEQALEDVIYFAQRFSFPHPDSHTASYRPHPSSTPWVFIGGSYSGIRAAYLRIRNPETIFASWASSAPVEAQVDFSSYWQTAERAIPRNCSNDWVAVTKYFDEVITSGSDQAVYDLKARIVAAEFTAPGGNTTLLEGSGYLQVIDQFEVSYLARYLMDPLGNYQVRLADRNEGAYVNLPSLLVRRTPSDSGVL